MKRKSKRYTSSSSSEEINKYSYSRDRQKRRHKLPKHKESKRKSRKSSPPRHKKSHKIRHRSKSLDKSASNNENEAIKTVASLELKQLNANETELPKKPYLSSTLRNAKISEYAKYYEDLASGKIEIILKELPKPKAIIPPIVTMPLSEAHKSLSRNILSGTRKSILSYPTRVILFRKVPQTTSNMPKAPQQFTYPSISSIMAAKLTISAPTTTLAPPQIIPKDLLYPVSSGSKHMTQSSTVKSPPRKPNQSSFKNFVAKEAKKLDHIQKLVCMRSEYVKMMADNPNNTILMQRMNSISNKINAWELTMAQNKPKMVKKNGVYVTDSPYALPQDYMMLAHNYQPSEVAMKLMTKMGWTEGKTLGKEQKDLALATKLRVEIKNDRIGFGTLGEMYSDHSTKALLNKHPVSSLQELCQKKKWPNPQYTELSTMPFLMQINIKGRSYVPTTKSDTKKNAKLEAARYALECMGFIEKVVDPQPITDPASKTPLASCPPPTPQTINKCATFKKLSMANLKIAANRYSQFVKGPTLLNDLPPSQALVIGQKETANMYKVSQNPTHIVLPCRNAHITNYPVAKGPFLGLGALNRFKKPEVRATKPLSNNIAFPSTFSNNAIQCQPARPPPPPHMLINRHKMS